MNFSLKSAIIRISSHNALSERSPPLQFMLPLLVVAMRKKGYLHGTEAEGQNSDACPQGTFLQPDEKTCGPSCKSKIFKVTEKGAQCVDRCLFYYRQVTVLVDGEEQPH